MSDITNHITAAQRHVMLAIQKLQIGNKDTRVIEGITTNGNVEGTIVTNTTNENKAEVPSQPGWKANEKSTKGTASFETSANKGMFDKKNWDQTGYSIEKKHWNETVFEEGIVKEEKTTLTDRINAKAKLVGDEIEALKSKDSLFHTTLEKGDHKLTADVLGYETNGAFDLSITKDGLVASTSVHGEAYLFKAEYEGKFGPADVKGKVFTGAEGNGVAELKFNPAKMEGSGKVAVDLFAGGKTEGNMSISGDYGKAGVTGGVSYGLGLEGNVEGSIKDGKVKVDLDLGVTIGIGANIGADVEVDVKDIAEGVKDVTGMIPGTPW